ncbi:MAG: N utilization substance protein B [bacterium]|nr:MAG: N utilization substance protein B [bacterium]
MGIKRSSREAAIKILYTLEFAEKDIAGVAGEYWLNRKVTSKFKEYAMNLVLGVCERKNEIDEIINNASAHWNVDRMPEVDRNILRLAVYELIGCNEIPTAVVINEAVELAKRYSGKESASFVNGVLGKIQEQVKEEK